MGPKKQKHRRLSNALNFFITRVMIHIFIWLDDGTIEQTTDLSRLKEIKDNPKYRFWLDLCDPQEKDFEFLESFFNFHPLSLKAVKEYVPLPRIDIYEDHAFLVLHRIFYSFEREECEHREFEAFFSEKYIITTHQENMGRTFQQTREKLTENQRELFAVGTGYVLFRLLQLAIQDYSPAINAWQDDLDTLERTALTNPSGDIIEKILAFKKLVTLMRKSLLPEREILKELYDNRTLLVSSQRIRPYLKVVLDNMNNLLRELDGLRDHAQSVFDVYAATLTIRMSENAHQLNFVMQRLTIGATIFLPLTFIAGIYGMNFDYFPELHWKWAYPILWIVMLALSGGMLWFFKRRKWL